MLGPVDQIRWERAAPSESAEIRWPSSGYATAEFVPFPPCAHIVVGPADGQIDSEVVICPLHLNAFELDTGCSRTGTDAIHSYPVDVRDGQLFLTAHAT